MPQIIITVSGRVGSGKTPYITRIHRAMEQAGYSVEMSDHELFSFEDGFIENHLRVRERMKATQKDVLIIAIGTGIEDVAFQIKVEPGIVAPMKIIDAFEDHYGWGPE